MRQQITIKDHKIVAKPRPRFSKASGGVYYPKEYVTSSGYLTGRFFAELQPVQIYPVQLKVAFYGTYGKTDLDNLCGNVMDSLMKARIIVEDNVTRINALQLTWERAKEFTTVIEIIEFSNNTDVAI